MDLIVERIIETVRISKDWVTMDVDEGHNSRMGEWGAEEARGRG